MTALTSPPTQTGPPALADRLLDRLLDRFLRELRAGVSHWVPDLLAHAATELESPAQRGAVAGDCEQTAPLLALLRSGGAPLAQRLSLALMQTIHDDGSRFGAGTPAASEDLDNTPGTPTLIGEAQIDEDIEIGRLAQIIDSATEAELQHLAALCSGLRRLDFADPAAVPLHPLDCARAVHLAVASLAPDTATRGLLLRLLGQAAGAQMRAVYATQSDLLQRWSVAAAPLRPTMTGTPLRAGVVASTAVPVLMASLWRMVEHARATLAEPAADTDDSTFSLRLVDEPCAVGSAPPKLDQGAAVRLIEQLFTHIEARGQLSRRGRTLLHTLRWPSRALAADEPRIWQSQDHPLWRLLDQLIASSRDAQDSAKPQAAGAADGLSAASAVDRALDLAVARLACAPATDRQAWHRASDTVQAAAARAVSDRADVLVAQLGPLQAQADVQDTEIDLRDQIAQQLRSTPVCQSLRQFLLGAWTQVLAQAAVRHGLRSAEMGGLALTVDDLIDAVRKPGQAVSPAQRAVLLRQVGNGLATAGFADSRVQAELAGLQSLLRNPPPPLDSERSEPQDAMPSAWVLDLNLALPKVPVNTDHGHASIHASTHGVSTGASTGATTALRQAAWFDALRAGTNCRLFLFGRWLTVQLNWVSDTRNLFLFTSRDGGRAHALTQRMLAKLREAGLATSTEDGLLLAQAMDSLVDVQRGAA